MVRHPGLSGWLLQTTRYAAKTHIRSAIRRTRREQEAAMQSEPNESSPAVWMQLEPLLDETMASLGETDRAALALRYFENRTAAEIGLTLKLNEEAAKKRVNRALEKLRKFFTKRGVDSTTVIIAGAISTNSMQAAPVGLAKTISVVAVAKSTAAGTTTLTLVKGALKIMAWKKTQTAIVSIGILLVAGTGAVIVKNTYFPSEPSYQGRKLSEWLIDVDNTHYYQPSKKAVKAAEAIRKMGAKTLPFLLADLGDARYKRYSRKQDKRTPDQRNSHLPAR